MLCLQFLSSLTSTQGMKDLQGWAQSSLIARMLPLHKALLPLTQPQVGHGRLSSGCMSGGRYAFINACSSILPTLAVG